MVRGDPRPREIHEHDEKGCRHRYAAVCVTTKRKAQQANVNLDWNPHKNVQNLNPYGANVISPEVRDDQTVTFRLKAPDVRTVALTGGPILLDGGEGQHADSIRKGDRWRLDADRRAAEA